MKVGVSSQADTAAELAEFASSPYWRNILVDLEQYSEDAKSIAANSDNMTFMYNKGCWHGALRTLQFLQTQLDKYKGN